MSHIGVWYSYKRLRDYALWYYFRYFPSNSRLRMRLKLKAGENIHLIEEVMESIMHLLEEDKILESKIESYTGKSKNISYISWKLLEKWFPIEKIKYFLDKKFEQTGKSILKKEFIKRKVLAFYKKWKSVTYIKNALIERRADEDIVTQTIQEVLWINSDLELIKREVDNIDLSLFSDNKSKNKFINKLIRKWFIYKDIKNAIKTWQ